MIDTSIYNNLLRAPKSIAEYDAEAMAGQQNKLALEQNKLAMQMSQAKMGEYQRGIDQENALGQAYKASTGADGKIDRNKLYTSVAQSGQGAKLPGIQKGFSDQDKADLEAGKAKLEAGLKQYEAMAQIMSGVRDQASYDAARQQAMQVMGPDAAARIPPVYNPAEVAAGRLRAMGIKDQMEMHYKEVAAELANKKHTLDVDQFGEVKRNNQATTAQSNTNSLRTAASAAAGRAQSDRHHNDREGRERSAPRGQVIQTEDGMMLVDPTTGQARPVTAGGAPVQPKLKMIPASANNAIVANKQSMSVLDKTIALLEGKNALLEGKNQGGQVGDSAATGVKGYLPQQMLNAIDPKGVDARAGVADIGSLKIHDRSGAAVTASESPRLMPFIPTATDSNATALKKLKRLREEADTESTALGEIYSKEQGYRNKSPAKPEAAGAYSDAEKERRYQEYKAKQGQK
jgi:hypothetical protein